MSDPLFELLLPYRPLSHQSSRNSLKRWKDLIYGRARTVWRGTPLAGVELRLTLVYLCDEALADIDNIIKPIQDALVGIVFVDDSLITDVDSHRRFLSDTMNLEHLPPLLQQGVTNGVECVYVQVTLAQSLHLYLS